MNKRSRDQLLALARILYRANVRIRGYVKKHTPKRVKKVTP